MDARAQGSSSSRAAPERTGLLARTLAELGSTAAVMLSGSAVGYYGNRGAEELTEESPPGDDFPAQVCQAWEAATAPPPRPGIRVVHLRTGIVLAAHGGTLQRLLLPFKLGLGGRIGSGEQYLSWITLDDHVAADPLDLLDTTRSRGAVNLTAPNPVTNAEFTKALGARGPPPDRAADAAAPAEGGVWRRARRAPARQRTARAATRVLQQRGHQFAHPEIDDALRAVLAARLRRDVAAAGSAVG